MTATRVRKQDLGSNVFAQPAVTLDVAANVASGTSGTAIQTDAHIIAFDTTDPSTQASGDAAAVGVAAVAARRDHKHAMPTMLTGTMVFSEVPAGDLDGSDATYILAHTPVAGTLRLYKNGIRQNAGSGNDYVLATATCTFEAGNLPQTGDVVLADYTW